MVDQIQMVRETIADESRRTEWEAVLAGRRDVYTLLQQGYEGLPWEKELARIEVDLLQIGVWDLDDSDTWPSGYSTADELKASPEYNRLGIVSRRHLLESTFTAEELAA